MAAAQHKDKGNAAFKAGDYPGAVGHYTAAILADSADPTFPLNRAAAYLKLNKNEDAERDCSTVLKLQANNVKAMFRRAQARVALGKLSGARADLVAAAKAEPGNVAVRAEFTKVEELISAEAKKAKSMRGTPISVPMRPTPAGTPYRRRVPISIVDDELDQQQTTSKGENKPSTSSSSDNATVFGEKSPLKGILKGATPSSSKHSNPASASTLATPPSAPASAAPKSSDLLTAVSTRALSSSSSPAGVKPSQNTVAPSQTTPSSESSAFAKPVIEPTATMSAPEPATSEPDVPELATSKPAATEPAAPEPPSVASSESVPVTLPDQPNTTPPTLVAFLQQWTNAESAGARTAVLFTVPPDSIPVLFGPTLESPLLGAMLAALAWAVSPASTSISASIRQRALEYMRALSRVPRFTTLVMFLDPSEKRSAQAVWDGIAQGLGEGGEVDIKGERKMWGC